MFLRYIVLSSVACLALSCASSKKEEPELKEVHAAVKKVKQGPEWTYSGAFGPKFWGDLDPSYILCKEGKHQSPIDLVWKKPVKPNPLLLMYSPSKVTVEDNGHAIALSSDGSNSIKMRNNIYNLVGVEFHSSSEHTISGKSFPAEIHFIHKNDSGFIAIVAAMIKEGKEHAVAKAIIDALPPAKNARQEIAEPINLSALLPSITTLYNYAGSLTTPPCTEGVNWIVYNTPVEFSKEQIDAIKNRYPMNQRSTQPLNDRVMVNY